MRSLRTLLAVALLLCVASSAAQAQHSNPCALPGRAGLAAQEPSGMGGTGAQLGTLADLFRSGGEANSLGGDDEESGMGGTGLAAQEPSGMGGTGVVGTITGFGSICVNGLRITYDSETPTERNGAASTSAELALGDVVSVHAALNPETGELRAQTIGVRDLVRGPLESMSWAGDKLEEFVILGQRITIPDEWAPDTLAEVETGDYLAVAGQRRSDGSILASRVVLLEGRDAASLIGRLELLEDGSLRVAGLPVAAESGFALELVGQYVVATGAWDETTRSLRSAELERALVFEPATTRELSVSGYLEQVDADGIWVGGVRVDAPRATFQQLDALGVDDFVVIRALLSAGGNVRAVRIRLDARPPRAMIPRPPRIERRDRPDRLRRPKLQRPALPKRPPILDRVPRPVRVLKQISG